MRIRRTLPPAAAPISIEDICNGFRGMFQGEIECERFKREIKEFFQIENCFLISSGKAALTIILQALHHLHPERDEVIIPAFTCYSVPSAIIQAGLKIRLCDINPKTLDFDYNQLQLKLRTFQKKTSVSTKNGKSEQKTEKGCFSNKKLLAVLPVHLFGLPADIERLAKIIKDTDIFIVEDAAQAMGSEIQGRKLGTFGDVGFFSLGRGKVLSTVEGGIIITQKKNIANAIQKIFNSLPKYSFKNIVRLFAYSLALNILMRPLLFGLPKNIPCLRLGETIYNPDFPCRKMSAFQAGMSRGWQVKLQYFKELRKNKVIAIARLLQNISTFAYESPYAGLYNIHFPLIRYPIILKDNNDLDLLLKKSEIYGLGFASSYPDSIDSLGDVAAVQKDGEYPQAKKMAKNLLTLPVHPFVTEKDINMIGKMIFRMKPKEDKIGKVHEI